jgi:hypothetical protein
LTLRKRDSSADGTAQRAAGGGAGGGDRDRAGGRQRKAEADGEARPEGRRQAVRAEIDEIGENSGSTPRYIPKTPWETWCTDVEEQIVAPLLAVTAP